MFLCFFMLDLISRSLQRGASKPGLPSLLYRHGSVCAAVVIVLGIIVFYSDTITEKGSLQVSQLYKGEPIMPLEVHGKDFSPILNRLRAVTGNSSKVYFAGGPDFEYYYYGGYTPVGYCNPFTTWIFTRDLLRFMQGLLDNGYYLVCDSTMKYLLPSLQFNSGYDIGLMVVVTKMPLQVSQQ